MEPEENRPSSEGREISPTIAQGIPIPSSLVRDPLNIPFDTLVAFGEASPEERSAFLKVLADRRLERLREALDHLDITPELEAAIRAHFTRFDTARISGIFQHDRRPMKAARLWMVTLCALCLIGAYTYAFLGTAWSALQIGAGTGGILLFTGVVVLYLWIAIEVIIIISDVVLWGTLLAISLILTGGAIYLYWYVGTRIHDPKNPQTFYVAARAFAVGAFAAPVGLILLAAMTLGILDLIWLQHREQLPLLAVADSLVVVALFEVLMLSMDERTWFFIGEKKSIISRLEIAARAVEAGFPITLNPGDFQTESWLQKQCTGIAASIRQLKRWICTPRADTKSQFISTVSSFLMASSLGSWDAVRLENMPSDIGPHGWAKAMRVTRTVVLGLGPLVLALVLLATGALPVAISTPILLFTGAFAFIILVWIIDPRLIEYLGTAREIAGGILQKGKAS